MSFFYCKHDDLQCFPVMVVLENLRAFEDVYELLIGYLLCYTIVCMSNTFSRRDNQLEDFVHLRSSVCEKNSVETRGRIYKMLLTRTMISSSVDD